MGASPPFKIGAEMKIFGIFLDREITEQDVKTSDRVKEFLNTNDASISELQQLKEKLASTEAELQKALAKIKKLENKSKKGDKL